MDITSMLQYYNTINTVNAAKAASSTTATTAATGSSGSAESNVQTVQTDGTTESFTNMLQEELTELKDEIAQQQENQNLVKALDGTVVSGLADLSDLSTDMLQTGSGHRMLQELMNGQFTSITTAPSDQKDNEEEKTVTEAVLGTEEDDEDTLDGLLKKMEKLVDTAKTSDTDTK